MAITTASTSKTPSPPEAEKATLPRPHAAGVDAAERLAARRAAIAPAAEALAAWTASTAWNQDAVQAMGARLAAALTRTEKPLAQLPDGRAVIEVEADGPDEDTPEARAVADLGF